MHLLIYEAITSFDNSRETQMDRRMDGWIDRWMNGLRNVKVYNFDRSNDDELLVVYVVVGM